MKTTNKVKEKLEDGEVVIGATTVANHPTEIELLGGVGFDFVWLDTEHVNGSPYDSDLLEHKARAADCADTEILIRVPTTDPVMIRKILDTGIRNITLPRVQTAEEVAEVARAASFKYVEELDWDHGGAVTPPDRGTRGASHARVTEFGAREGSVALESDENVMLGVVIEDYEAIPNIDEILSVPGVGYTIFGPYCMSISIGKPGEYDHPKIQDARETFVEAATRHDVPILQSVAGMEPEGGGDVDYGELETAKEYIDRGKPYQMFRVQSGSGLVRRGTGEQLATLQAHLEET
jgi:2-keto-3-deoxy-L-rhamnonate aldolase RhmA